MRSYREMRSREDLRRLLQRIDGRGYKAYRETVGSYEFDDYTLFIDHAQGDPFAAPSRVRVEIPQRICRFPEDTYAGKSREIALRDYLSRRFCEACRKIVRGNRGTGKSGLIGMERPGQEIMARSSAHVSGSRLEARLVMGLPAFGRRVAARHAQEMLFEELPKIVRSSLLYRSLEPEKLYRHVKTSEDADVLRSRLASRQIVAFVANGSVLPRASGVDPRPLTQGRIVPFEAPESLEMEVNLPNRGFVKGMGIPSGVTLIVGGGYHGKSTLLKALELGIYNHIPGDGREIVVTDPNAVKIRAEDGRRVEKVDISPFISNLPFGRDTRSFSTEDASGSTSQAANIIEALETGATLLLIDEDTSATNFMIRDQRMQELVAKEREPITPFLDKVRQLHGNLGISTILVLGGSGDYFDVADRVLCMVDYEPLDMTERARAIAAKHTSGRRLEGGERFGALTPRTPLAGSLDPSRGKREVKISAKGLASIVFGRHTIDLGAVEQLVDPAQTATVGDAIHYATRYMDGNRSMREVVAAVTADIESRGLDVLNSFPVGDYAAFRSMELSAAINRLRTLKVRQL
jgi:predicted ABC-class ATPase